MPSQNINSYYFPKYTTKLNYGQYFDLTLASDEVNYDEGDKVDNGHEGVAAVSVGQVLEIGVAVRRCRQKWLQDIVPAG